MSDDLLRPISNIEARSPQEVFDIMAERFRKHEREEAVAWRWRTATMPEDAWVVTEDPTPHPRDANDGRTIEALYLRPDTGTRELIDALREARIDLSNTRTNIMIDLGRYENQRWEGVPEALKSRIDKIDEVLRGAGE